MAATSLEPSQDEAQMEIARMDRGAGGARRVGFGLGNLTDRDLTGVGGEPQLAPDDITLVIQDGLLMALGPDGDPVPPGAFAAAVDAWPKAEVALQDGPRVPAEQAAAVLASQAEARQRGEVVTTAWLGAMLGIGPQPETVTPAELADELAAEQLTCELTAIGDEILISPTAGEVFLITDAKGETVAEPEPDGLDGEVGQLLMDGRVVSAAIVAGILRDHEAAQAVAPTRPMVAESALADCVLTLDGDRPVLRTPVGAIALVGGRGPADQPRVRLFQADGRPASLEAMLIGLGLPRRILDPAVATVDAATLDDILDLAEIEAPIPEPAAEADAAADGVPAPLDDPLDSVADLVTSPADPPAPTAIPPAVVSGDSAESSTTAEAVPPLPLVIEPPCPPGVAAEAIAVIMVRGLPAGARLSAGVDDGGGSWTLRRQDLAGLRLHLATAKARLAIEIAAIAVVDGDGTLAAATERAELAVPATPVPLPLAMAMLDHDRGRVDALVIRGVPDHARLSAGLLDAAIDGWVLRPAELPGLTLMPAIGARGVVELTVRGITLGAGGGQAPAPIQLSVSLD